MFRRYGYIAAAGDRHLAEFMPGDEYLNDPQTVRSWKFGLTTVDYRKEDLKKRPARLTRMVSNVNIPNTCGQIPDLPGTAVAETNAVLAKDSDFR